MPSDSSEPAPVVLTEGTLLVHHDEHARTTPEDEIGIRFTVVTTERYSKLTLVISTKITTIVHFASTSPDAWIMWYGISDRL